MGAPRKFVVVALLLLGFVEALRAGAVQYLYDELGRLIAVIDTSGDSAVYHYDAVGNLLSIERHASSQVSIISFSPASGSVGTTVTINGTGFSATTGQNSVTFNGASATVLTASLTKLTVTLPAGATSGAIAVTSPNGSATSSGSFTVTSSSFAPTITSFSPTTGTVSTAFGIDGTNFDPTPARDRVALNGSPLLLTSATATHLATTVPSATTSGRIRVTTVNGSATSSGDFWVAPPGYTTANLESKIRLAGFGDANAVTTTLTSSSNIGLILFDGSPSQRVSVKLSSGTMTGGTVSVLSPYGVSLASASFTGSAGFVEPIAPLVVGPYTYTVMIQSASAGHATLTVYDLPADPTGPIVPGGSPVTTSLMFPGQNGHYTFSGTAGQKVSLKVTDDSIALATVSILNPDGSTVGSGSSFTTSGGFIDATTLTTSGTYTILVDPNGTNTGSLKLTLYDASEQTGTIATGSATTVTTSIPGQNARLSFSGTSGHRYSLKINGGGPTGVISILDQNGTTSLGSASTGIPATLIEPVTLAATGTYYVLVDYTGTTTGSVTLTLYDVPADLTGTITPGGSAVSVDLSTPPGLNAIYTLATPTNSRVSLIIGATSMTASVLVRRPDGTTLTSGLTNVVATFVEPWTFVSGQTIKVDPTGANTGSVTLTAYDVPADLSGTLTIGGGAVNVAIPSTQPGRNGSLTFSGTASQQVTVRVTGNNISIVTVKLLSTNGTTVLTSSSSSSTNFNLSQVTLPSTGTYTVVVDPFAAYTGSLNVAVTSP